MQTFLPYPSFFDSAEALDNRRLGKQRVEAYQILRVLQGKSKGWQHHPAVKMWRGYESALQQYLRVCILEWVKRGFRNTLETPATQFPYDSPPWLGDPAFHASHRSNLLRKDRAHYGKFGWTEPDDLPYVWPVVEGAAKI